MCIDFLSIYAQSVLEKEEKETLEENNFSLQIVLLIRHDWKWISVHNNNKRRKENDEEEEEVWIMMCFHTQNVSFKLEHIFFHLQCCSSYSTIFTFLSLGIDGMDDDYGGGRGDDRKKCFLGTRFHDYG